VAKKLYDICLPKESYQKDGETKTSWENIGVMMQGDNGPFLLLDPVFNLAGFPRHEGKRMLIASLFKNNKSDEPDESNEEKSSAPF
jgi:hypothetical protein